MIVACCNINLKKGILINEVNEGRHMDNIKVKTLKSRNCETFMNKYLPRQATLIYIMHLFCLYTKYANVRYVK